MDWWSTPTANTSAGEHQPFPAAYVVMFAFAAVAGIISLSLLRRTPDLQLPVDQNGANRPKLWRTLAESWKHSELRNYMLFRSVWMLAVGVAVPYYTVYMLETLHLNFTQVFLLQNIGALAGLLATPLWGKMLDRYGCKKVLFWTSWLKAIYVIYWILLPTDATGAFIALIFIHASLVVNSGLNLSSGNLLMNLMPEGQHQNVAYYSVFNTFTSLISALGPLLAGILLALLGNFQLNLFGLTLGAIPLLFVLSGLLRLASMGFFKGFDDKQIIIKAE